MRSTLAALLGLAWPASALATDYNASPADYRNLLTQLGPGDRLLLAAGEYPGLPIDGLDGTSQDRIVISGPETGAVAVITGRSCCNTISVRNSSYVTVRYLDVDARGELVDGLKAEGDATYAHNITVEHNRFYGFGQDQQIVGINTKCPAWDWVIRSNTIYDAGTGLYLGDSTGGQPFVRGIIEQNLVVNPIGYNMQIKHQTGRPAGIGMPTTDSTTIIRHNVFIKEANASVGVDARPNLLVGHFPPSGTGSNDRYEIYGNFFFENESGTEALFQGEGRFTFHDNVMVNSFGTAMYAQPQNGELKDIAVYHNTILAPASGIEIYGGAGYTQSVVANAIFSGAPITGGVARDNITAAVAMAGNYVANANPALGVLDLYPSGANLSGAAVDLSPFAQDLDRDRDFDSTPRDGTWRGAYHGGGAGPGWILDEAIKVVSPVGGPGPDAGVPDSGPTPDGGPSPDTGMPADAGPGADATPGADAQAGADAGDDPDGGSVTPGKDASTDAGPRGPSGRRSAGGGCGCGAHPATAGTSVSLVLLLVGLAALRRRATRLT